MEVRSGEAAEARGDAAAEARGDAAAKEEGCGDAAADRDRGSEGLGTCDSRELAV